MTDTKVESRSAADVSGASPSETPTESAGVDAFLIARGGPYYNLQQRMGLLHERALNAGRRAAILVGLAWGVPLVLSAIAGHALGASANRPFLLDLGAWARFFVAIGIFVLMERMVEERLRAHLRQFARAPLIHPGAQPAAAEAVVRALRRRDLRLAELVCVVAAYAITLGGASLALDAEALSWLVTVGPEGAQLTAAGWWCALVSSPLFWFLLLRWLWRHAVWGLLLRDLARLELRLVATHPDGAGGLAFIGQYPNAFAAFVFALSCVLGAAIAHTLLRGELTTAAYGQLMAAWLVIVIILFGLPLLAFSGPLRRLKEVTILAASAVASRHERAAERELLGSNMSATGGVEVTAADDIPDTAKLYAAAKKLSTNLISREAIVPLAAAALLPLVAAGATQLPVRELLKAARGIAAAMII
jgi:hypothetical protein